ncbi:uncharacterized protein AMSG_02485 [Thecamonas trahens ATCC 50062]|uniref:PH domain-containing protein n=1 Tax=Thecamonas trahens ATCC 50062 TaxID=461836 RepID=A0A0L0D832_THETB|nr:hypothetical protein AMSG_02485 [Thecamonas trahens ATCC 50062]KNC47468.1 hypothetical protein AMSG_02485 [Thecamonas trahens ATCC 50062]|eukprot:XP_013759404.1 hypothetical protein AMSG_02485 [Thecamonas trahens ATCC 50062]
MRRQQEQMRQDQMRRQQEQLRQDQMRRQREQMDRDRRMREDSARRQREANARRVAVTQQVTAMQHATMAAAASGSGGTPSAPPAPEPGDADFVDVDDIDWDNWKPPVGPGGYTFFADGPVKFATLPDGSSISKQGGQLIIMTEAGGFADIPGPKKWTSAAESAARRAQLPAEPVNRAGNVVKLSKARMAITGSARWQKRFLVMIGSVFSYYKTEAEASDAALARGVFTFGAGSTVSAVESTTPRQKDAFELKAQNPSVFKMMVSPMSVVSPTLGVVGRDNVFAIHIPARHGEMANDMVDIVSTSSVFSMASKINAAREATRARTYYFQCTTAAERDAWIAAIQTNLAIAVANGEMREKQVSEFHKTFSRLLTDNELAGLDIGMLFDEFYLTPAQRAAAAAAPPPQPSAPPADASAPPPSAPPPSAPPPSAPPAGGGGAAKVYMPAQAQPALFTPAAPPGGAGVPGVAVDIGAFANVSSASLLEAPPPYTP